MKTNMIIQSNGVEISDKEIVAKVKEKWVEEGKLVKDIKSLTTYIKPEERKVYYVINDEINGDLDI